MRQKLYLSIITSGRSLPPESDGKEKKQEEDKSPSRKKMATTNNSLERDGAGNQQLKKSSGKDTIVQNETHKVIVNLKQLSFEEKISNTQNKIQTLQVIDSENLVFYNQNEDPKKQKIIQKEKNFEFDYIQDEQADNQLLYKQSISSAVQKFVAGINQSVLVLGGGNSGKLQTMVGNIRDPGIFILALKEIFDVLYSIPDRDNSSLKMSMFGHKGNQFYDLLVDHGYPLNLLTSIESIEDISPLGLSTVIVNSLMTALKILKIGIDKVGGDPNLNIVLSFKCIRGQTILVNQEASYSTFKIIKMCDGGYQEMTRGHEDSVMENLSNCLKILSKQNAQATDQKTKNEIAPFNKNIFTEYLKDTICGNSQTTVVCCLNNTPSKSSETAHTLRLGNQCRKTQTLPHQIKLSPSQMAKIYTDTVENIQNTIGNWLKEFWGELDKVKQKRVRVIFGILRHLEKFFKGLLDTLEHQMQIDLVRNGLLGKILDLHCKEYSCSITSEDIKEFYIAKIQLHSFKSLQDQLQTLKPAFHIVLSQAEDNKKKLEIFKKKLFNFMHAFVQAKKMQNNPEITDLKLSQEFISNAGFLSNLDLEKIGYLLKLFPRYLNACQTLIDHNLYIPQDIRQDSITFLKDYKLLEKTLKDEGVQLGDQTSQNLATPHRFLPQSKRTSSTSRSSFNRVVQQYNLINKMRLDSQKRQTSEDRTTPQSYSNKQEIIHEYLQIKKENTIEQFHANTNTNQQQNTIQSVNNFLLPLKTEKDKPDSIIVNTIQNLAFEEEEDEDDEDDKISNEEGGGLSSKAYFSSKSRKPSLLQAANNEKLNTEKIKQLQTMLKIVPKDKKLFVNHTKLSFTQNFQNPMHLARAHSLTKLRPDNAISSQKNDHSLKNSEVHLKGSETVRMDGLNEFDIQKKRTHSVQNEEKNETDLNREEENELVRSIFTKNIRYASVDNRSKNMFLTQANKESITSPRSTTLGELSTQMSFKMSMTGVNFKSAEMPSSRKYPNMINTFAQFKLPKLSETLSKKAFNKFFTHKIGTGFNKVE